MPGLKAKVWIQIFCLILAGIGVKSDNGELQVYYPPESRSLESYLFGFNPEMSHITF